MGLAERRLKAHYEERNCIICKRIFYVPKEGSGKSQRPSGVKSRNTKTCSKECSREYFVKKQREYQRKFRERNRLNNNI